MSKRTISSREFNQDVTGAKQAALKGPVVITDRGKPSHVLLSIDDYEAVTGSTKTIVDLIAMPGDFEFNPKTIDIQIKPADFT